MTISQILIQMSPHTFMSKLIDLAMYKLLFFFHQDLKAKHEVKNSDPRGKGCSFNPTSYGITMCLGASYRA